MMELTVAARDSFMIVKRALSISGGKFVVAMTVATLSSAMGAPSDRIMVSSKFSGLGELADSAVV